MLLPLLQIALRDQHLVGERNVIALPLARGLQNKKKMKRKNEVELRIENVEFREIKELLCTLTKRKQK